MTPVNIDSGGLHRIRQLYQEGLIDRGTLRDRFSVTRLCFADVADSLDGSSIAKISISSSGLVLDFHSGVRLNWDPQDYGTPCSLAYSQGSYEPDETALMLDLARGKSVFVDVGANIGWFTLHLASVLAPNSRRIFAFEPVAATVAALRANAVLNGLGDTVTVLHSGVGDEVGELEFHVPQSLRGASSLRKLFPEMTSAIEKAPVTTLDLFDAQCRPGKVDILKCDVEGAELMVARGGLNLIARDRPVMMFELLRKWSLVFGYHPNAVIDLLSPLGYACFAIGKGAPRLISAIEEETEETNFLFLAPEHVQERRHLEGLCVR